VPGATENILRCLEAFGLEWDGSHSLQSQQDDSYLAAIETLDERGLIYRCHCSRRELRQTSPDSDIYPGNCRHSPAPAHRPHALRVRVLNQAIALSDLLQGDYLQNLDQAVGDFIVKRRDGLFAYHLATVIDDAALGITEVMRGVDLLESTPRQIHLQRCLDLPTPAYAHLPVLVDGRGCKLSKQTGATAVDDRDASAVLFRLLWALSLEPPAELRGAEVREMLGWGVAHWDADRLAGIQAFRVEVD
jgi:glutamyl-Q tRNA(Asp) synthetase